MNVYLAKSNKANPDNVMRVRQVLQNSSCEVVEFAGGTYNNKDLIESDVLIMIPENLISSTEAILGRGLFGQLEDFSVTNHISKAFIVTMILPTEVSINEVVRYEKMDERNWQSYGKVFFREESKRISDLIKPIIEEML